MAVYDYNDRQEKYLRNQLINYLSNIFSVVFTIELIIKVIAKGYYFGKGTYMKDGWNVLDFMVVVFSWIVFIPGLPNLKAIRTVRVVRPLRSI
jgi:hypothetical protein